MRIFENCYQMSSFVNGRALRMENNIENILNNNNKNNIR